MTSRRRFLATALTLPVWQRVALAAPAADDRRIVALDWAGAEALLALGLTPTGVADAPTYRSWFPDPPLPPSVQDVGPRWEPNRELLRRLAPTLLLTTSTQSPDLQAYGRLAPLFPMDIYQADGAPYASAAQALRRLAAELDRASQAEAALHQAQARIAAARATLPGRAARPAYVVILNEDGRHATFFGQHSLAQDVLDQLGLTNAWAGQASARWGYAAHGIETFARNADAWIVCIRQGQGTQRALNRLRDSSLWNGLAAVRAQRVRVIDPVFPFAGVPGAARLAGLIAAALQEPSS